MHFLGKESHGGRSGENDCFPKIVWQILIFLNIWTHFFEINVPHFLFFVVIYCVLGNQ